MSRIQELIANQCPEGVALRALGDIAELVRGNGMPKTDLVETGVGAIHYGQIYTHYGVWATETISCVTPDAAARLASVEPGDIVITNTSENVDDVCKAVAWLGDKPAVTGGHATVIKHGLDPKYLSYWFQSSEFSTQKRKLATGTKVIDVSANQLAKVRVPVPPIEVQREIVRVLDHFTELEAELEAKLEAELQSRRRQFASHRDRLITCADAAPLDLVELGRIGRFVRGRRFTKADMAPTGIPCIHYGEIYTHYGVAATSAISHVRPELGDRLRYAVPGDVVFAAVGETVADVGKAVAWMGAEPVAIHDDTFLFRSAFNPKYVAYAAQTLGFRLQKDRHVARAKVKRLSGEGLSRIAVPSLPLKEQARIVEILDEFDALVNDLSVALRAELAARRQQYEHYRDKLLTFKELGA